MFLLSGLLTVTLVRSRLVSELDEDLTERATTITAAIDLAQGLDFAQREELLPSRGAFPSPVTIDTAVTMLGPDGTVIVAVADGTADQPAPGPDLSDIDVADVVGNFATVPSIDGSTRYRVTAVEAGDLGTAVLGMQLTEVERAVRATTGMTSLVGLIAALIVAGAAWSIIRRGLRPIDSMIATAEEIAAGDLTSRVAVPEPETEVGHLGTALNTMLGQIQEGVDAKVASEERMRSFVSDASHELRTPLTSIRGYAELHERGALDDAGVEQAFARIGAEARRMGDLVEDLLTLARLDQAPQLTLAPTDLTALLGDVVQDARTVEPDRQIALDLPDVAVTGEVDADRIRQAVGNLLTNARIHTPAETPVSVLMELQDDEVAITVTDEGPGLEPEHARRVFDRFYQARPDRTTTGSGLGLAIVRSIAEAHGGSATIDTAPGDGMAVTLRLPLVTD